MVATARLSLATSWDAIFDDWEAAWEGSPDESCQEVIRLTVPRPPEVEPLGTRISDWWPTPDIEHRRRRLEDFGVAGATWHTTPGQFASARMLRRAGRDWRCAGAAWMAASLWDLSRSGAPIWERVERIAAPLLDQSIEWLLRRGFDMWPQTARQVLPEPPIACRLDRMLVVRAAPDMVELTRLQAIAVRARWSLVAVTRVDEPEVASGNGPAN